MGLTLNGYTFDDSGKATHYLGKAITSYPVPPEPEPEWKVGDRFRFSDDDGVLPGLIGRNAVITGETVAWNGHHCFYFHCDGWSGTNLFLKENANRYCLQITGPVAGAPPRERQCSTCQRNADCGRVCWWCGSEEGSSR